MVGVPALAGMGFEHGRGRFLDLQEDRIVVGGHEQGNGALRSDAPDPHDLHGEVAEVIAVEQGAKMLGQQFPVERDRFPVAGFLTGRLLGRRMEDQWRIVLDDGRAAAMLGELREQELRHVLVLQPFEALPYPLAPVDRVHLLEEAVDTDGVVPHVERPHRCIVGCAFAIAADGGARSPCRVAFGQANLAAGDHHAGSQPLEIPLPGRRQGLVEVVDVEDDAPLGRGETAEVRQVGVAAGLHADPRDRCRREVGRHDRGRSAIESEGRLHHPGKADRHQLLQPALVRRRQEINDIAAIAGRFPAAMCFTRYGVAQHLALAAPFIGWIVVWLCRSGDDCIVHG